MQCMQIHHHDGLHACKGQSLTGKEVKHICSMRAYDFARHCHDTMTKLQLAYDKLSNVKLELHAGVNFPRA